MRDVKKLVKLFEENGFTLARQRNHMIWRCPCGHAQITVPTSPGKPTNLTAGVAYLNRTKRACKPTRKEMA